ncbi:MAG: DUF2384 domain-containing protein [Burkholderiales bacterium]|nr:DUF2384 domain-containing protein [Burkholderiales bacterium]
MPSNPVDAIPPTLPDRLAFVLREVEARLGSAVAATYMRTPNFALGGLTPTELLETEQGTRQVLAEVCAQAEGGPL